jgi:isopentenyl-diphosphate delta-isomerase
MDEVTPTSARKADHLRINLEEDVQSGLKSGLDRYRFIHQALPELDLDRVDLTQVLFNKSVNIPILISSMTGGTKQAGEINRTLARAAQEFGLAMGLGSMRAVIEHPDLSSTFRVRDVAPDILLFANLGAIQLNYGYDIDDCLRVVEIAQADALILHLNPLQEALQPEGQTNFSGLLARIHAVCKGLPVPVIVKEVGWGISERVAFQLANVGVAAIDVAGAGGTSWSQVEMYRNSDPHLVNVASIYKNWGIPTAESIRMVHRVAPNMPIFASGGLTNGLEIAKCIALGACLGGMAGPFLRMASKGFDELIDTIQEFTRQIRITMFAAGVGNLKELQSVELIEQNT